MDFTTKLVVNINGKIINTVHEVRAKYSSMHIGSTCEIIVPLNSILSYADKSKEFFTAYPINTFVVGDMVTVTASYPNTGLPDITIFAGTVFEFKEGTPCTIKCIDYLALLGHMQNLHYTSVTLKTLITTILKGTGISLLLPSLDLNLVNLTFRTMSPWAILEWIKKSIGLNISLSGTSLFCNVASTTLNTVAIHSGRNIYDSVLQQPDTVWQGYRVKAWFVHENGIKDSIEVGDKDGHLTEVYFYKVSADITTYTNLASQALIKVRQRKFSGKVWGYLYPDVKLFDKIQYTDIRYPDKSGNYVCTEIEWLINDKGFHKEMTLAYLLDFINLPATNG